MYRVNTAVSSASLPAMSATSSSSRDTRAGSCSSSSVRMWRRMASRRAGSCSIARSMSSKLFILSDSLPCNDLFYCFFPAGSGCVAAVQGGISRPFSSERLQVFRRWSRLDRFRGCPPGDRSPCPGCRSKRWLAAVVPSSPAPWRHLRPALRDVHHALAFMLDFPRRPADPSVDRMNRVGGAPCSRDGVFPSCHAAGLLYSWNAVLPSCYPLGLPYSRSAVFPSSLPLHPFRTRPSPSTPGLMASWFSPPQG